MPSLPMSEGGPVIPKVQQSAEDDQNLLEAGFNVVSDRGVFIIFFTSIVDFPSWSGDGKSRSELFALVERKRLNFHNFGLA